MTTWLYVEHVLFGFSVLLCCVLYYCFLLLVLSCVNTFISYILYFSLFLFLWCCYMYSICMLSKQSIWIIMNS